MSRRKPTALKRLAGNPGGRPLNKNEPQPERLAELPKAPATLNRYGKRLWTETGAELLAVGLLTRVDLPSWELCCLHYGESVNTARQIRKDGATTVDERGLIRKHPLYSVLSQQSQLYAKYASLFGLDPSNRSRLTVPAVEIDEEEREFSRRYESGPDPRDYLQGLS